MGGLGAAIGVIFSAYLWGKASAKWQSAEDLTQEVKDAITSKHGTITALVERTHTLIGKAKRDQKEKRRPLLLLMAASIVTLVGAVLGSVPAVKVGVLVGFGAVAWKVYNWAFSDYHNRFILRLANQIKKDCDNLFPIWFATPPPSAPPAD